MILWSVVVSHDTISDPLAVGASAGRCCTDVTADSFRLATAGYGGTPRSFTSHLPGPDNQNTRHEELHSQLILLVRQSILKMAFIGIIRPCFWNSRTGPDRIRTRVARSRSPPSPRPLRVSPRLRARRLSPSPLPLRAPPPPPRPAPGPGGPVRGLKVPL
ncbi:hypothetical protein GCM10018953_67510 [Streptosporangium nondiastaticum]